MGVIFAKTPKGQEAIELRTGGLTPRVRRVLIFVDGKRTVEDLRGMLLADDLQHTLGMLEEEGFIQMAKVVAENGQGAGQGSAVSGPLPAITAFRDLTGDHDPVQFQMARNFMTNTLNAFVGSLGASSLLERIERSVSHQDLRQLFDEWYHALVMSRDGKREAESLRTKLLGVI